jgi:hypothetical protein
MSYSPSTWVKHQTHVYKDVIHKGSQSVLFVPTHVAAGDHEGALVCSVNIDYFSVILVEYL